MEHMAETPAIEPPRWMTKAEKAVFNRIISARKDARRPVSAAEIDMVCDYAMGRSRIDRLRKRLRNADPEITGEFWRLCAVLRPAVQVQCVSRKPFG